MIHLDAVLDRQSKMKRRRRQCGQICLLLAGISLFSTGVAIFVFFESIYDFLINEALRFTPTTLPFTAWKTNDPPLTMDIYMFNWTNAQQVRNLSVKPEFQEVGPYRFKEVKDKVNIKWHEHNKTISYMHDHKYYFDEENSVRPLSDVINTLNSVPLAIAYKSRHLGYFSRKMVSMTLSTTSPLYVTKRVGQLLFEGYDDPILSALSKLPFSGVQDKFGYFYGRNGSVGDDGLYSMYYGNDEHFGEIMSWNYKHQTDYFSGQCNDIKGSTGEFYPLNRQRDKLLMYSPELCRYTELEYVEDVNIQGVHGFKFTSENFFDNGTKRPENACFCTGECIPSGLFNISSCRQGSPSFLSFPHFYNADPYYLRDIKGLKPEKSKHEFYITMEPKSGIIMDVQAGMQVNMLLQPIRSISMYEDVPKIYVPLFYFSQVVKMAEETAQGLKMFQALPEYATYLSYVLCGLGTISILWAICSCFCCSATEAEFELDGKTQNNLYEEVPLREEKSQKKYIFTPPITGNRY
ncbi:hypothetical protein JTB14_028235 [Gonioctena quinquepunctata]|nr:hypothetical protein JTB14_028235 [Gonioctena quinquepunctata]